MTDEKPLTKEEADRERCWRCDRPAGRHDDDRSDDTLCFYGFGQENATCASRAVDWRGRALAAEKRLAKSASSEGHYERLWRDEQEAGKVIRRERDEALRELERVKAPASAADPRCACGHVEEAHLPDGRCIEWVDVPGMRSCGCERFRPKDSGA